MNQIETCLENLENARDALLTAQGEQATAERELATAKTVLDTAKAATPQDATAIATAQTNFDKATETVTKAKKATNRAKAGVIAAEGSLKRAQDLLTAPPEAPPSVSERAFPLIVASLVGLTAVVVGLLWAYGSAPELATADALDSVAVDVRATKGKVTELKTRMTDVERRITLMEQVPTTSRAGAVVTTQGSAVDPTTLAVAASDVNWYPANEEEPNRSFWTRPDGVTVVFMGVLLEDACWLANDTNTMLGCNVRESDKAPFLASCGDGPRGIKAATATCPEVVITSSAPLTRG